MNRPSRVAIIATVATVLSVATVAAQDTIPPHVSAPAGLHLPPIQVAKLPNGLTIRVVEMHEVPLVEMALIVKGGGRLDGRQPGIARFTASMLDEGAGSLDAFGIASQAAFLGAQLGTGVDWDNTYVTLNTPKRTLGAALDLMTDVALRPTFKSSDVIRERDLRVAQIIQSRDQPRGMAALAFAAIVYPATHPYHQSLGGDSASVAAFDSATVRGFYQRIFRPDQAELVVTGDITLAQAKAEIASRFGKWLPNRMAPVRMAVPPAVAQPGQRSVDLVDKPGAAQSIIMIGGPGVSRSSPDYAAIEVMNTILGGSFSSRLNQNLRETRGYTYGASSGFTYRPAPGPFVAQAAVRTDVTDSSLVEFFRELNNIRDSAVSLVELERARNYIVFGLPAQFETVGDMGGQIEEMLTFGLAPSWLTTFVSQVSKVSAADVQRVAKQYFDPAKIHVVVVGDLEKIRPGIEALSLGPMTVRDLEGRPVVP